MQPHINIHEALGYVLQYIVFREQLPSLGSRLTTQAGKLKELLAFAKAVKTGFTSRAQHVQNTQTLELNNNMSKIIKRLAIGSPG